MERKPSLLQSTLQLQEDEDFILQFVLNPNFSLAISDNGSTCLSLWCTIQFTRLDIILHVVLLQLRMLAWSFQITCYLFWSWSSSPQLNYSASWHLSEVLAAVYQPWRKIISPWAKTPNNRSGNPKDLTNWEHQMEDCSRQKSCWPPSWHALSPNGLVPNHLSSIPDVEIPLILWCATVCFPAIIWFSLWLSFEW